VTRLDGIDRALGRARPEGGSSRTCRRETGFGYLEVLVATALIAISLVPALEALSTGGKGYDLQAAQAVDDYYVAAKLEEVLAQPFAYLDEAASDAASSAVPSSYSDTVTLADGRVLTRQVYLSRYDGDNADGNNNAFDGTDDGLLWIRVEIEESGLGMERLISVYEY
jgi:type II secretory pathway pseudopilin PulG